MLSFILFKSKEFTSLISLCSEKSKSKRYISQVQTKVIRNNNYIEYSLHERMHREEKELNRVLPAIIYSTGTQLWYKNGRCHRDERDENGRVLPAYINSNGDLYWYRNGKQHRDDLAENGKVLPAIVCSDGFLEWWIDDVKQKLN